MRLTVRTAGIRRGLSSARKGTMLLYVSRFAARPNYILKILLRYLLLVTLRDVVA